MTKASGRAATFQRSTRLASSSLVHPCPSRASATTVAPSADPLQQPGRLLRPLRRTVGARLASLHLVLDLGVPPEPPR